MGNERRVWVYTPPGYAPGERSYPMLVLFDGGAALSLMPTHRLLDNLLADGRIGPMVAVFVDNATDTSRNHELPCSEDFARFIETELIPWVRSKYARLARSEGWLRHRRQLRRPGLDVDGLPAAAHLRRGDRPGAVAVVGAGLRPATSRCRCRPTPKGG